MQKTSLKKKAGMTVLGIAIAVVAGVVCWFANFGLMSGPVIVQWTGYAAKFIASCIWKN